MLEKIETWLPVFSGFYGFGLEDDRGLEWTLFDNPHGINRRLLDFVMDSVCDCIDYPAYHTAMAREITNSVCYELMDQGFITTWKFQELYNGSINIEVTADINNLIGLCKKHPDFEQYIKDRHTSYDGFSSHYTNDPELWLDDMDDTAHKIGSMLQFLIDYDSANLYEVCSEIFIHNFIDIDKLLNLINIEFDENLFEFSQIEDCMPGKAVKSFLQRLTGIRLFEIDPEDMEKSDFQDEFGLNFSI
jgi:hypothetical protein